MNSSPRLGLATRAFFSGFSILQEPEPCPLPNLMWLLNLLRAQTLSLLINVPFRLSGSAAADNTERFQYTLYLIIND